MLIKSNKIKKDFTITINYQPKKLLSISICKDNKMMVKTIQLKKNLTECQILKHIHKAEKEFEEKIKEGKENE